MLKLVLIIIFNVIFLPLYIFLCSYLFFATFLPIFPSITAKNNIKERLGITGLKNKGYVTLVFLNYVFYLFEIIFFDPFHLMHSSMEKGFSFVELMTKAKEAFPEGKDKGFIYILGHVANVESYTIPIIQANDILKQEKIYALASLPPLKILAKILTWYRTRPGLGILWTDLNLLSKMSSAIEQGCSLALLVDQKPKKNGVFIKFFGKYAAFPNGGLRFCMEKKAIILYIFAYRILPGWLRVNVKCGKNLHLTRNNEIKSDYTHTNSLMAAEIFQDIQVRKKDEIVNQEMAYFVNWFEKKVKMHPTQWCWDYNKWSRDPK